MEVEGHYVLDEAGNPVEEKDLLTWARWFESADRTVARDQIDEARISTVFLGMDHSYTEGPPVLYETMVFGGQFDLYEVRYQTQEQALVGHGHIADMISYLVDGSTEPVRSQPAVVLPSFNKPQRQISLKDE